MKILLTGANGYIGSQLLPLLAQKNHEIFALVRDRRSMGVIDQTHLIEGDLLNPRTLEAIPDDIEAAYYLVHSMKSFKGNFSELEATCADNFQKRLSRTKARQIIYLSGIANEPHLSKHLASRKYVDEILRKGTVPVTTLMAGIILGKGSASFQIISDLAEKLPIMIAPRWVNNLTQPIAIEDILDYLLRILNHSACLGEQFEIGGPDILSYKELLLKYAHIRGLKRTIFTVPLLTPRLSSYWLYFVTSASFPIACSLVGSLINNSVCKDNRIKNLIPKNLLSVEEAIKKAIS